MAEVTVDLTGYGSTSSSIHWTDDVSLGATFSAGGVEQVLGYVQLFFAGGVGGLVSIYINGTGNHFTPAFTATGRLIFEASDGTSLEIMIANADMFEAYIWTPSNSAEVIVWANHVWGLADHTTTLTLTDDDATLTIPSFSDDTGTAQSWIQNVAISPITAPAASGNPTPTYAVISRPPGINFDAGTRVISGAPTTTGSGRVRIRATNSQGSDDWTVDYTIATPPPVFAAVLTLEQTDTQNIYTWTNPGGDTLRLVCSDFTPIISGSIYNTIATSFPPSVNTVSYDRPATQPYYALRRVSTDEFSNTVGPADNPVVVLNPPGTPGVPTVTARTLTSISLSTVPGGGGTPWGYRWRYSLNSTVSDSDPWVSSVDPTVTIEGLTEGTSYWIDVRATNFDGHSSYSFDRATSTMAAPVLAPPGTPGVPTVTARTLTSISLSTVPGGGGAATLYRWRHSLNNFVSDADPMVTSTGPTVMITGLAADTDYWIDVRAENADGNSFYTSDRATSTLAVTTAPDLTVDTPTIFGGVVTLTPGQDFSLSVVVRNGGDGDSTPTTLRWRRSTNSNITTSDPQIGTDAVPIIVPFGANEERLSLVARVTPGTYYYGATVDAITGESDRTNNSSGALAIVVAAPVLSSDATLSSLTTDTGVLVRLSILPWRPMPLLSPTPTRGAP